MSLKLTVIIYHKNIKTIYRPEWVEKCLDSIRNQTYKEYRVFELCYSDVSERLWEGSEYIHKPMTNHIAAMNYILDLAFADGCDVVFNVNLDDFYHPNRFTAQLAAIHAGYELVSSNFQHIEEVDGVDVLGQEMKFHDRDILVEAEVGHNILCHPVIAYTKGFWNKYKYYNTNELGYEDFNLWKKAAAHNCKICILEEILCYYRLSPNQTGRVHAITPPNNLI